MYKQNSKLIFILIFLLIVVFGNTAINAEITKRTENIKNNSSVSKIPYATHYNKFQESKIETFKKLNLGKYGEDKLLIGYGLSDKKEQNCYFVNMPANKNITTDFVKPIVLGKKTFLISRRRYTYSSCKSLADKYTGFIANPITATENTVIRNTFTDKDYWIGLTKTSCGVNWLNQYNITQEFNFLSTEACNPKKLRIFSPANKFDWLRDNKNGHHYCLLQIDSKDYLRPLKVCAPWWQIEQIYSMKSEKMQSNLAPFYNISVPKKMAICIDTNNTNISDYSKLYNDKSKWVDVTCTSYYSRKGGASCMDNMLQEQCKVDECRGSVEDRCILKSTFSSKIKDYTIGTIADVNGMFKTVKMKDKIKTHLYSCPPPRPSIANCKKYDTVLVSPTDKCNPGGCNDYFNCLNTHPNNASACDSTKCERRYGTEPVISADGKIEGIRVRCSGGGIVINKNINVVNKTTSRCKEYNTITKYITEEKNCNVNKTKKLYSISSALDANDIYMDNPNCVRLNNEGKNVKNTYNLDFKASKYFYTKISKVTAIMPQLDVNGSKNSVKKIIMSSLKKSATSSDNAKVIDTLDDLAKVFNNSTAIVVGDDNISLSKLKEIFFTSNEDDKYAKHTNAKKIVDSSLSTTGEPVTQKEYTFKYFNKLWFVKRLFPFEDENLTSITRPYSTLAQCLNIPLDMPSSASGSEPSPNYKGDGPKISPLIVRENYENNNYMEKSTDNDILYKGFYCKRQNLAKYIDWQGKNGNDLYYNEYLCSRLYGSDGKVWATPTKRRLIEKHAVKIVNGTSKKRIGTVYDYTLGNCPSGYLLQTDGKCKGTVSKDPSNSGGTAYGYCAYWHPVDNFSTWVSSEIQITKDSVEKSSVIIPLFLGNLAFSSSLNKCAYYSLYGTGYGEYTCPVGSTKTGIGKCTSATCPTGTTFNANKTKCVSTEIVNATCSSGYTYDNTNNKCKKLKSYNYYEYKCPNQYVPKNAGHTTYTRTDTDKLNRDTGNILSDSVNSATSPKGNCIAEEGLVNLISNSTAQKLTLVTYDTTNKEYCKRITPIISGDAQDYADYNCSKYFDASGNWSYQIKRYYMYNANGFKSFREKYCGNGKYNQNNVSKDGSNAMLLSFNVADNNFINIVKQSEKDENKGEKAAGVAELKYSDGFKVQNNYAYKIPDKKLTEANITRKSKSSSIMDIKKIPLDNKFEIFRTAKNILRLSSVYTMSDSNCKKYYLDLNQTSHIATYKINKYSKCIIDYDYFDTLSNGKNSTIPLLHTTFKSGNFNFSQTGFNSILAIESYIDGPWGYKSNYSYKLYKDSNVSIDGKLIYPIKAIGKGLSVVGNLYLYQDIYQKTQIVKGKIVPDPASFAAAGISAVAGSYGAAASSAAVLGDAFTIVSGIAIGVGVEATAYVINLFAGDKKYGESSTHTELYMDKTEYRTYPNVYGNDYRINLDNEHRMLTIDMKYNTGTLKKGDDLKAIKSYAKSLKNLFINSYGVEKNSYEATIHPADISLVGGYPGFSKWDKIHGKRKKTRNKHYTYNDKVKKMHNVVFYGATNQISIFVPFESDYEIIAIDKKGNIIGKKVIYKENYIKSAGLQPYQQIYFSDSRTFNIAEGIKYGKTNNACSYSNVTEWGGGVSGAYYTFGTPKGYTCQKSNDKYVKDHAAQYIAIRRLNSSSFNIIKLQHPMPYANRVFVVSLGKLETRKYACYRDANCIIKK